MKKKLTLSDHSRNQDILEELKTQAVLEKKINYDKTKLVQYNMFVE
jgi:hypothetical protein